MIKNPNWLPYFKAKHKSTEKTAANFLLGKFRPSIKEKFPGHYLIQPIPHKTLESIREKSKKYPYFLRFDVRLYYPSVNHEVLLKKLPEIYQKIAGKPISRRFKKHLKEIPGFLSQSPYGKGIPIGSRLSYVLAGIFLLDLDREIKNPFLRQTDDYLIFCKRKKEPENLLRNVILPKLQELRLEINEKKLSSGRFHRDKVNFIGFDFYAGYFTIAEEKIEEFKKKVVKLTHLTGKKPEEAIMKSLNNQILGFGHYYKPASCKKEFEDLDAFIRMRLRRYVARNKDSKNREGNLLLTNSALERMGLKSLLALKEKYTREKRRIPREKTKNKAKTGKSINSCNRIKLQEIELKYQQKLILAELKQLTSLTKKLERQLTDLKRKLGDENKSKS